MDRTELEIWLDDYKRLTSDSTVELDADGKGTEFREWWHKIG
jgi:hypothetical protein